MGQLHINQSQLIDIAITGFEEVSNVTIEYLRNVSYKTSYCQGYDVSIEHVIEFLVFPTKILLVTATMILSIVAILIHYELRLKSLPPDLPVKDYLSGSDLTDANETNSCDHRTSSLNIVLQTIENNKQGLGNKAVSCPMSSFQISPNNSQQIPDAIGPDQSMSTSSEILRLESFCNNLQKKHQ